MQTHDHDPLGLPQHAPGAKLDATKPDTALVFDDFALALLEVAKVGTYGAKKYTPKGWISVPNGPHRYKSAGYRHLLDDARELFDQESGLRHLAHAAWDILAVLELALRNQKTEEDHGDVSSRLEDIPRQT